MGLSIIELLVVVAVIAILAGLLFPIFPRARAISYRAKCANNLRQFATAFSLYEDDWSGFWPCPGGQVGDKSYWSQSGSGGLQSYVNQRGVNSVWCCPLLPEWRGKYPARSYSMNSYLRFYPDVEYPTCLYPQHQRGIKVSSILVRSKTVLLFEGIPRTNGYEDQLDYLYRCANWSRVRGYTDKIVHTINPGQPWHGRCNNYLYCDGHIVARPPGRKTTGSYSSYDEMYQWYVDKAWFEREFTKLKQ